MPIYDYNCKHCGQTWDELFLAPGEHTSICSSCGMPGERQLSASSFHLKGTGWARDGYGPTKARFNRGE